MRIISMTNEGQLSMMKNMLNSAKKAGFPMDKFHCYILGEQPQAATYMTAEFRSITLRKLEIILENMCLDNEVIWIDNDIVLFENTIDDMKKYKSQFVMQNDIWSPCTGFFLVRSSPASIRAIQKAIQWLKERNNPSLNDQHAFRAIYMRIPGLCVDILPDEEYPNGLTYFDKGKTSKAKIVHNNYLSNTAEKTERFKKNGLWDDSDDVFETIHRHYI